MQLLTRPLDRPIQTLIKLFIGWKLTLLFLALCSPGPGYDTSSSLDPSSHQKELPLFLSYAVEKLTRWDAIYFVKVANRGYLYEQEWAFGWGFSRLIHITTFFLGKLGIACNGLEALVAITIAHVSHLLSVLALFHLTQALFSTQSLGFALTTASLHIISPAGIFLSAPYAEGSCALLSFAGCLLFTKSLSVNRSTSATQDLLVIGSGLLFGLATTFRSNGILNGLLLLEEAFRTLLDLGRRPTVATLRRLLATGLGGLSVGVGFLLPQYIAYTEYCKDENTPGRPWCYRPFPSIYIFVQDYYWNCGFLRYWTLSNLPLFLLGTPIFALLTISAFSMLTQHHTTTSDTRTSEKFRQNLGHGSSQILRNMAISQLGLVLLTLTTAHVQIITRLASAYPVWLWYTASSAQKGDAPLLKGVVAFSVIYATIQAALFASFLPPA